ncbi:MAG: hypothetical protein RL065_1687 [Bacteroidota bacterium]
MLCSQIEPKSFSPTTLLEWVQLVSYLISAVGIYFAGRGYFQNRKLKRAEWLKSLFEKFYEKDSQYKQVRIWLDYNQLTQNDLDNNIEKQEKLADYLNFFEFIATLEKENQLSVDEINNLFAYYLTLIKSNEICMNFINEHKFLNLSNYLNTKHHDKK